jgi:hypothetical protein
MTENVVGNDLQISHNYSMGIFIYKLISVKGLGQSFDMEFRTSKGEGDSNYSDYSISCCINAPRSQAQSMLMDDNMGVLESEGRRGDKLSKNDLCRPASSPLLLLLLSFHSLHFSSNNKICSLQLTGFAYHIHFNSLLHHFHNSFLPNHCTSAREHKHKRRLLK